MAKRQEETRSLNFSGNARSYGTAKAPSVVRPKSSETIRHDVCEGDTLQGLALRYGVTVEDIRLENKLWTNDSMFLRPHLMIPLSNRLQPQAAGGGESGSRGPSPDGRSKRKKKSPRASPSSLTTDSTDHPSSSASTSRSASPAVAPVSSTAPKPGELDKSSVSSFLASFDTQLTMTKSSVEGLESTVAERVNELGAAANANAHAAAVSYAERSRWEQKMSGRGVPPASSKATTSSSSVFSSVGRFLPSRSSPNRTSMPASSSLSKLDSKKQAEMEAQDEEMFDL